MPYTDRAGSVNKPGNKDGSLNCYGRVRTHMINEILDRDLFLGYKTTKD